MVFLKSRVWDSFRTACAQTSQNPTFKIIFWTLRACASQRQTILVARACNLPSHVLCLVWQRSDRNEGVVFTGGSFRKGVRAPIGVLGGGVWLKPASHYARVCQIYGPLVFPRNVQVSQGLEVLTVLEQREGVRGAKPTFSP